jgi:O-antigen ligase
MPEHLRALVVILVLATGVFALVRTPACAAGTAPHDFNRRCTTWFLITLTAFLAHSFWIYVAAAAAIVFFSVTKEKNQLALFFALLFAVPAMSMEIPGVAGIRYLFDINHVRLLALAVLLPAFISLVGRPDVERFGRRWPDRLLIVFLGLYFVLMLPSNSATSALRLGVFYPFIDVFLPYYVASRSLKDVAAFRDALTAFVVAALVLAAIGIFESGKHWLLYRALEDALGAFWNYGGYLPREEHLRALGSTGQPIAFGYVMAVAMGFLLYLRRFISPLAMTAGFILLGAALFASVSRGPWLGAALILLLGLTTGRSSGLRVLAMGAIAVVILPLLFATTMGARIIDYLPFVGSVDSETVSYRVRLLEAFVKVIVDNPLFGAYNYMLAPEVQELRQGQGIVDIVNTYVGIGLTSGLVGLTLFVGFFAAVALGIMKGAAHVSRRDADAHLLGQVLLATLLGILVIIFTVSSITVIPVIYWAVAGLGVGYARMTQSVPSPSATEARAVPFTRPRRRPLPATH